MDFLTWALTSATSTTLILIAGYLGRSQLSHWLNKDLEAQKSNYQRELEAQKAAHQRDLEVYKVSLIAETERLKASQDVQKAIAIRLGEKKFDAFDKLHRAMEANSASTIYAAVSVNMRSDYAQRTKRMNELLDRQEQLRDALSLASPFLHVNEKAKLSTYISRITNLICELAKDSPALSKESLETENALLEDLASEANAIIHTYLVNMLAME